MWQFTHYLFLLKRAFSVAATVACNCSDWCDVNAVAWFDVRSISVLFDNSGFTFYLFRTQMAPCIGSVVTVNPPITYTVESSLPLHTQCAADERRDEMRTQRCFIAPQHHAADVLFVTE